MDEPDATPQDGPDAAPYGVERESALPRCVAAVVPEPMEHGVPEPAGVPSPGSPGALDGTPGKGAELGRRPGSPQGPGPAGPEEATGSGVGPTPDAAAERVADRAAVRDALGVGVAVGLSGFAFGVTAVGAGLSWQQTCALSLLVFTGASQFALVGALAAGSGALASAAGALFLGARNAIYGLRLSTLLRLPAALRPFAAQWVIDETTAVALAQPDRRRARIAFAVAGACLYLLWNLTTLLGALGAAALGDPATWGLDAAGPAVFLALLAPMLRTAAERATAALAVLSALVCLPLLPAGVPVLVAALAAPVVLLFSGRSAERGSGSDRGRPRNRMRNAFGEAERNERGTRRAAGGTTRKGLETGARREETRR